MNHSKSALSIILLSSVILLSACGPAKPASFSDDTTGGNNLIPLVDKDASAKINITKTLKLNEAFPVSYKTTDPNGVGSIQAKARSLKEIPMAGKSGPNSGKKLILVEISVMGNPKNKGNPSTFNQIGSTPSPQFVMVNRSKNTSEVETTYFSDSYTAEKKLFELSKITLDQDKWVDTALVFETDLDYNPDLAFRFTNPQGQTEFYGITPTTK